ncbi:TNT domain-containing protein [Saccharothrix sp. MB29]|nr:TNT domain-containing protein [Saccharothrix sp. MB29]
MGDTAGPTTGAPGDEHSPAAAHEWPADTDTSTGTDPGTDPGTATTTDPFPQKNVWNQPAGVVEGFSHDGPYHSVHESTGPTDQSVGTYDQRAAAIVEPGYQPYGPHGGYEPFRAAHSTRRRHRWPPNQGAGGPGGRRTARRHRPRPVRRPGGDFLSPLSPEAGVRVRRARDHAGQPRQGYHVYVLDAPLTVELAPVAPAFDQAGARGSSSPS